MYLDYTLNLRDRLQLPPPSPNPFPSQPPYLTLPRGGCMVLLNQMYSLYLLATKQQLYSTSTAGQLFRPWTGIFRSESCTPAVSMEISCNTVATLTRTLFPTLNSLASWEESLENIKGHARVIKELLDILKVT